MQDCPFPTEPRVLVRLDIWEKGNISLLQLSEKLHGALRHALCDAVMEFLVLPAPLCVEAACPLGAADLEDLSSAGESPASTATSSPLPGPQELGCAGGLRFWGLGGRKLLSPLKMCCGMSQERSIMEIRVGKGIWRSVCSPRLNALC